MKILITGATNGMGKGLALALASSGEAHEIIVHGRSEDRCARTVDELAARNARGRYRPLVCDLASLSAVAAAGNRLRDEYESLDAVFVNAGLGYAPRQETTEDGLDPHFQVNYLSHFMLVNALLDLLAASEHGGRVIFNCAPFGSLDIDDLQMTTKWGYERGVGQSMVAKRMLAAELRERVAASVGSAVAFVCYAIPKTVWSNQISIIPAGMRFMARVIKRFGGFIDIETSGRMMTRLFTMEQQEIAQYSGHLITTRKGRFTLLEDGPYVGDAELRRRLWEQSVELCSEPGVYQCIGTVLDREA